MKTLQEDVDDLDRMVDTGAAKDAIRSQIRLVAREVAALETDLARSIQNHKESDAKLIELDKQNARLVAENAQLKNEAPSHDIPGGFGF